MATEIVFPENIDQIISDILAKYDLTETSQEVMQKVIKGEDSITGKIAQIIKEAAKNEISVEDLISHINIKLNLPKTTAEQISDDIQKRILNFVEKKSASEEKSVSKIEELKKERIIERQLEKSEKPKRKTERPDVYREPVE